MNAAIPGPRSCFISHSYGDEAALAACLAKPLPEGREPFVFPPIEVSPNEAVSDALILAIKGCGGLVYFDTPQSRASFWVGFERNLAARLGKSVYAFRPGAPTLPFLRDERAAVDPIIAVLFNMCVEEDIARIQEVRTTIWDRYNFEIRGDKWRRIDNDARQMLDSIDGMLQKFANGGIALLFLSSRSITSGFHDYVDPATFRRSQMDMETPTGYTGEKFAALDPARTVTLWLDEPEFPAIDEALDRLRGTQWASYVRTIRGALVEPQVLVAFQPDGRPNLNSLDTMLARAFSTALEVDARLAAEFRGRITDGQ